MSENGHNGQLEPERLAALAAGCLLIDDARLYGLIEGGPEIDREQCDAVLERLGREGIVPTQEETEAAAIDVLVGLGAIRP